MVVEDDCIIAEDIRRLLITSLSSTVYLFDSGEYCLNQLSAIHPDMVILDLNIRGPYDGVQTARFIRSKSDVPMLFITANTDSDNLNRISQIHNAYLLKKPFHTNDLSERIKQIFAYRTMLQFHLNKVNQQITHFQES